MKLTLAIACYNELEDTKGAWGCHVAAIAQKTQTQLVVVDNGSTDGTAAFLERFVFPHFPDHTLIRNADNVGVVASMQQCYEAATGEWIAFLHNDLFVFEHGWDDRLRQVVGEYPDYGLIGFLGARGIGANGGRIETTSNLLDAEVHGHRDAGFSSAAVLDGLALIAKRSLLHQLGGIDQSYTYHHFYDRDLSMATLAAGAKVGVLGVFCHHRSGVTANRPTYQRWISQKLGVGDGEGDKTSYDASERRFFEKWGRRLPIIV